VSENILVFPAEVLDSVGYFNGFSKDVQKYTKAIFESGKMFFTPKEPAEVNPQLKQLIPYILIKRGNLYYNYQRTKNCGEPRLHNLMSLGIGGHVNDTDDSDLCNSFPNAPELTYYAGLSRELQEELNVPISAYKSLGEISGLLYDPTTLLGQIHFGIVHIIDLVDNVDFKTDNTIRSLGFRTVNQIKKDYSKYEKWSQLVIDNLL
jgi:predicted NUDIX family phosphoesterase